MIQVTTFVCNAFGENTYVVGDTDARQCAIIDPGCSHAAEWAAVRDYVAGRQWEVRYILLTHSHIDHFMGSGYCTREYGIGVSGSLDDQLRLPDPVVQARLFGIALTTEPAPIVHALSEGDRLTLGTHTIEVIDVPGHSPHGLCYYVADSGMLFSGDVLFCESVGRADFGDAFGCNGRALIEGIVGKLMVLPPDVVVWPGHGPQTTIGHESRSNPYF